MDMENTTEVLAASFDLVARQDEAEKAITVLRSDVDEVKARLDRVSRAAARPALDGVRPDTPEVKGFVDGYLRRGREAEIKSINGTVPTDGGYAVPREIDAMIAGQLRDLSPIRQIAQVVQVGSAGYRKLIATGGTASGWVAETDGRPETATPQFQEVAPPTGDLYANPAASQAMLDDAASTSKAGSPARSPASSPGRKARPSSPAAASTSRRASWPRRPRPRTMRRGRSARCNMSAAAMRTGSATRSSCR